MKTKKQSTSRSNLFKNLMYSSAAAVVGMASQAFGQEGVAQVGPTLPADPMGMGEATGVAPVTGPMAPAPNYGLSDYVPPTGDAALRMSGRPQWQDELGPRLRLETRIGDFLGTDDEGVGAVNVMLPFMFEDSPTVVFLDTRGTVTYQGQGAGSIGGGLRYYDEFRDRIYGVSGWWDYDDGHAEDYQQIAFSFESIGRWVDMRLNTYFALGDETTILSEAPTGNVTPVQNGFLVEIDQRVEAAYNGVSFEVGGPMPILGRYGFEGFVGGYHFWSDAGEDATGYSLRTAIHASDDVRLGVQITNDNVFDTEVFGSVILTLPDGRPSKLFRPRGVSQKMLDRVERRYRVTTETFNRNVNIDTQGMVPPSSDDDDGFLLSNVIFVDPVATTNGVGTFEDPFNTFVGFSTPQPNTLIVVRSGDVQGEVRLPANSLLLSEAYLNFNPISLATAFGPLPLPALNTSATAPVFSNPTGGTLVTLVGDNTEVAGFTFDGTTNGTLLNNIIEANGVQGVRIHDNEFRNYATAIDLRNVTGTIANSNATLIFSNNFYGDTGRSFRAVNIENSGIGTLDLELGATDFNVNLQRGTALPARGNFTYGNTGEDANGNGLLDAIGEDTNNNGVLDSGAGFVVTANNRAVINARIVENSAFIEPDSDLNGVLSTEDTNRNGTLNAGEDANGNGVLDFDEDLNQNGVADIGSGTGFIVSAGNNGQVNLSFVGNRAEQNIGDGLQIIANQGIVNANELGEDLNGNGRLDGFEDVNRDGVLEPSEDLNGNGVLDGSEDVNNNGILDPFEDTNLNGVLDLSEDLNGNGILDLGEDLDGDGIIDLGEDANEDANGNGIFDPGEDLNGDGFFNLGDGDDLLDRGFVISENRLFSNGGDGIRIDALNNSLVDFRMTRNLVGDATNRSTGNDGIGLNVNADSGSVTGRVGFVYHEDINFNGILDIGEDTNANGRLDVPDPLDGNQFVANMGGGINFNLFGTAVGDVQVVGNAIIGIGGGEFGFRVVDPNFDPVTMTGGDPDNTGDTTGKTFFFDNNSVLGVQIDQVTWNIASAGLEFNTDAGQLGTPFAPTLNSDTITGLIELNGDAAPLRIPTLSTSLDAVFNDFDPVNGILDDEDINGNAVLDPGEDINGNGVIDTEDANGNGVLDLAEDLNENGVLDAGEDLNGNGILDPSEDLPESLSFTTDLDPSGMANMAVLAPDLVGSIFDITFNTGQQLRGTIQLDPADPLGNTIQFVPEINNLGLGGGIAISAADNSTLQPSTIFNNVISDFGGDGIAISASESGNIQDVLLRSNRIDGNGFNDGVSGFNDGISFLTTNSTDPDPAFSSRINASLVNNLILNNVNGGIRSVADSGSITFGDILDNTLLNNGSGISLTASNLGTLSARVTQNSILNSVINQDNSGFGVDSTGTGLEITADNGTVLLGEIADNVISVNAGDGIILTADNMGSLLVQTDEDVNGNGLLDQGEDANEDLNLDGILNPGEDANLDGVLNLGNGNGSLDRGIFNNTLANNAGDSFTVDASNGSTVDLGNVTQTALLYNTAGTGGFVVNGINSFVSGAFTSSTIEGDQANNPTAGPGFLASFASTTPTDGLFDIAVGGSGLDDGNTFSLNTGAGVAFVLTDAATGSFVIENNEITGTTDDMDPQTPFSGDGISVTLTGGDQLATATARLTRSDIVGNIIGDFDNATLGTAGSGIAVLTNEDTTIEDLLVANNLIGNAGNDNPSLAVVPANFIDDAGIRFDRLEDSRVNSVNPRQGDVGSIVLDGNVVRNSGDAVVGNFVDGLQINAENGIRDNLDFEIRNSEFSGNSGEGIQLNTLGDSSLATDLIGNLIENNVGNGIILDGVEIVANDLETQGGTWIQNTIRNNGLNGIQVNAVSGDVIPLIIGQLGEDPITGESFGNIITDNTLDGIEINSGGNVILDNNLIARNGAAGIDLNADGIGFRTALVRENVISENILDGFEVNSSTSTTATIIAFGNAIDNNQGRGVDVLIQDSSVSNLRFGDGSFENMNRITNNDLEGFYVVSTSDATQDQQSLPGSSAVALEADTDIAAAPVLGTLFTPDLILDVNRNEISGNNSENATTIGAYPGGGLGLRIGTSGSLTGAAIATRLADSTGDILGDGSGFGTVLGVGANNALIGNGRTNARIINNTFEGNLGEDVFINSFTSTQVVNSGGMWDTMAFAADPMYQSDPLARLNLVFRGNTGDSLDVTEIGAVYAGADAAFKSRDGMANPPGPFAGASTMRERNAQRLPARGTGTAQLAPGLGSPDLLVGNGYQYPGVGQSTFRVEADNDVSGFLTGQGFSVDFLPVPPPSNANGELRNGPGLDMPFGWTEVPPGTFQFDDPFLTILPQPATIPGN